MSEPFLGEIRAVGFNFAPRGWLPCQGQLLSIAQNSALFSLLGTTFGGDGVTTFALPDYRGRLPLGMGNGPGLTPVVQGQVAGTESTTLTSQQMPMHTHTATTAVTVALPASTTNATVASPTGAYPATVVLEDGRTQLFAYASTTDTTLAAPTVTASVTLANAGGSQPVSLMTPYLGTNFIIATEGIFPSRP